MLSTLKPRRAVGEGLRGVRIEKKIDDKYSLKNLIFMPSKPSYTIPTQLDGHRVFACMDCGDKFVCESSYNYHVNRRSVKITYTCRICTKTMIYMNRCNLLSHIRSHVFKTATINLVDLKLEPLPVEDMLFGLFHLNEPLSMEQVLNKERELNLDKQIIDPTSPEPCVEAEQLNPLVENVLKPKQYRRRRKRAILDCVCYVDVPETIAKARVNHYNNPCPSGNTYTCPACSYLVPNKCALKSHLLMHAKIGMRNSLCPECGESAHTRKKHGCPGYNRVISSIFLRCPAPYCGVVNYNEFHKHFVTRHMKQVFHCSLCETACLTRSSLQIHMANRHQNFNSDCASRYYQCSLCPKRLVLLEYIKSHVQSHKTSERLAFKCRICEFIANSVGELLTHYDECSNARVEANKELYNVVKKCEDCSKEVTFQCYESHFVFLPSLCVTQKCPGKLSLVYSEILITPRKNSANVPSAVSTVGGKVIRCPLCRLEISMEWGSIKSHFKANHSNHRCIDLKLNLRKVDTNGVNKMAIRQMSTSTPGTKVANKRKRNNTKADRSNKKRIVESVKVEEPEDPFRCRKCGDSSSTDVESFRRHLIKHRDPNTAYQCMECGRCYVVKPSFSTHLFVAHGIKNAGSYIRTTDCFNPDAFKDKSELEPVKKNQCRICREQFDSEDDLGKHFRVHGMAFLMTRKQRR